MQAAELRERRQVNASPNRRIRLFENDEQLREVWIIRIFHD
jgi:hypothetical protein